MAIHPVDVATGVVSLDQPDFGRPGVLPLSWVRHYSTGNLHRSTVIGQGWSHNFDHRLRRTLEGWCYEDERGCQKHLPSVPGEHDGVCFVQTGDTVRMRQFLSGNPETWLVFQKGNGKHFVLRAIERTPTQRLVLRRDRDGRINQVIHERSGCVLQLRYDGAWLTTVSFRPRDGVARVVASYDNGTGVLARVFDIQGERVSFAYDAHGRIARELKCTGTEYSFCYDGRGRCIDASGTKGFERHTLQYDDAALTTDVVNSRGASTRYLRNAAGQVLQVEAADGGVTHHEYDSTGRLTATTGPLGDRTEWSFDPAGRLVGILDPIRGRACHVEYSEEHRPIRVVDFAGAAWTYAYDELGCVSRSRNPDGHVWEYHHNEHAEFVRATDPLGGTSSRRYRHGDLVETFDVVHARRSYERDEYGRVVCEKAPNGSAVFYRYDKAGRLFELRTTDGITLRYEHDAGGRVVRRSGPGGVWKVEWSPCGCPLKVERPDGAVLQLAWGPEPGQLLELTDWEGKKITWTYDEMSRPITRTHWDGTVATFRYDLASNVVGVDDGDGRLFTYLYDAHHNLLAAAIPGEDSIAYGYDILDQLVSVERGGARVVFERDCYGAIVREKGDAGTLRRTRDALGRPVMVDVDHVSTRFTWERGEVSELAHGGTIQRFEYDAMGRNTKCTLRSGALIRAFSAGGKLLRQTLDLHSESRHSPVSHALDYDAEGHLSRSMDPFGHQKFSVDAVERLVGWTWDLEPYAVSVQRTLDRCGNRKDERVEFLEEQNGRTHVRDAELVGNRCTATWDPYAEVSARYTYDRAGRVTSRVRELPEGPERVYFSWSAQGFLLSADVDGQVWAYEYDPLGRRVAKVGPDGTRWTYQWDDWRVVGVCCGARKLSYGYLPYAASPSSMRSEGQTWDIVSQVQGSPAMAISADGEVLPLQAHLDPWGRPFGTSDLPECLGFWGEQGSLGAPGQIHDPETGLFYNVHRYYDPLLGAFISPDPTGLMGGVNEYGYVPDPMRFIDPTGLRYINGGPLPWFPGGTPRDNGRPRLTDPRNRFIDVGGADGTRRQRVAKRRGRNHNGKCLAVIDGVPDAALPSEDGFRPGDTPAFVSGHGHPHPTPRPDFNVRMDAMGNWCHAEIQALHFLAQNNISGATVWVDRPPCPMCARDLDGIMDAHFPGGDGRSVTVMYFDPDSEEWSAWEGHRARKAPPCGG